MKKQCRPVLTAMLCAAAATAQFVGAKATRDALFLTSFPVTALPTMLIVASLGSILLVATNARGMLRIAPARLVPGSFAISGLLFLVEWLIRANAPSAAAIAIYLHVSSAGPLLLSGVWLITDERFDPRTAKRRFGQIAGAGTVGGLVGALVSERVAALLGIPTMLLVLSASQFLTGWLVWVLATRCGAKPQASMEKPADEPAPLRSGFRIVAEAPHLRHLMVLVLLGTTSAALLDYLFKVNAVATFGRGDGLLRFFALYYAATSLISFVLQALGSRFVLERFGLALTTSTPSMALLGGSLASLVAPGFGSLLVARGGEAIFRGSWFRAGYELFYTPLAPNERRAAKSVIDVALDRAGDAVGGGLVRLAVVFLPAWQASAILVAAMAGSVGAILAASQLNRWYARTLESSLVHQAGAVDPSETRDGATSRFFGRRANAGRERVATSATTTSAAPKLASTGPAVNQMAVDPIVEDLVALRSGDRTRAIRVLSRPEGLAAPLVAHVIPLLASDVLANYALFALRKVAEERIGELTDALVDPNQDFAVRRRLPRVFSVCVSQRAADGLLFGLDDARFEVRFQAARSLASILEKNPLIHVGRHRIEQAILREIATGAPIWEGRRLVEQFDGKSPLDDFLRDRAGHSLDHVFTLLSLILPGEPLRLAFRSVGSDDRRLRGTALEYLEGALPVPIRHALWPFIVPARSVDAPRPRNEIYANLLRSSASVTLHDLASKAEAPVIAEFAGA